MLTAYQTGAKYIVIFNYAKDDDGNTAAAMTDEHYLALNASGRIHTAKNTLI